MQGIPPIIGDYTLGALLGRGGSSEVYECSHAVHGDRLALKLLRDAADGAFQIEAKMREVHHGSVVRVIDAGTDPATGRGYLVMERLDGPDLATHLARGPLDEPTARALLAAVADGMQAVHTSGLVHRDLKPANVMLHAGAPRIVDFGIAKLLGDHAALVTSRRIGTLAYMAPEQLVGGRIAPSVDVWALGIMLFEAVTGQRPFGGFTESYSPQLVETAPRVRSLVPVSAAYDTLVARCLDPDPAKRPAMAHVARVLRGEPIADVPGAQDERVTQDIGALPVATPALPPAVVPPAPPRRRRAVLVVAGLGVAAAIVATTLALTRSTEATPAAAATAPSLPPPPAPAAAREPAAVDVAAPTPPPVVEKPRPKVKPRPKTPAAPVRRETLD